MEVWQHTGRIRVHAAGFWCEGEIGLPRPGGYKGRILDVLNSAEEFIALTDVTVYEEKDGAGEPRDHQVLLLRKAEIRFAIPLD